VTDNEREIMATLCGATDDSCNSRGFKPMDCGGFNGSHHSGTMARLARRGWLIDIGYRSHCRRVCIYRLTEAGRSAWENWKHVCSLVETW
jgi:hypothetical protein